MNIKYKKRPSDELLKKYKETLEKFLSAHDISVDIKLWDKPLKMESYTNGNLTEIKYLWIEYVKAFSPELDESLEVNYIRSGIDKNINERDIWRDAYQIQDALYRKLGKLPTSPPQISADPYWRLWDYLNNPK